MKRITLLFITSLILGSCGSDTKDDANSEAPKGTFTVNSPIEFSEDPDIRQEQQEGLVKSMLEDPGISLETIESEAARRGVTLTDDQRDDKRKQQASALDTEDPSVS